ncbi:hypothetical protein GGR26_001559 [Lewinella marina]|uniref:Uncharacterized protein n=1 Tax=Neolewinella marina TaxID=438751 RepID=A0A2G0CF21_9BACT|nr:hypothetical protein [Neolewinella marina]NJB85814.1 hypothetical protein [Neolewinella marina]PHK98517.1 hypothetical protein CGL56_08550 [Neolewinella marina]
MAQRADRSLPWITFLSCCLLFTACGTPSPESEVVITDAGENCNTLPPGSRLPRFGAGEGRLLLSYVISDDTDGDRLYAREFSNGKWTDDREVTAGEKWFVNWADYPSVKPFGDRLFYHYLAYAGEGTYDYDVRYGIEGGAAASQVLHTDGIPAEHGFVSSAHLPDGKLQVTWLDGRNTKQGGDGHENDHAHHGSGGAMTLRTATLTPDGEVSERTELDGRVCDCCNTATVATANRVLVAYRDRSEQEVRDIGFVVRKAGGNWSDPQRVHADEWEVTGCPVNGPALGANDAGSMVIAWYTAAGGTPRIQFARYDTLAESFSNPLVLDDKDPLGRVDLKLGADGTAYVLGVCSTDDPDRAAITLWTISPEGKVASREVARTSTARSTGFPRLALHEGQLLLAHTDTDGEEPVVQLCTLP